VRGNSACLRSTSQAAAYQALSGNDDGMAALRVECQMYT
jgi:hypothetical protein